MVEKKKARILSYFLIIFFLCAHIRSPGEKRRITKRKNEKKKIVTSLYREEDKV